MLDLTGFCRLYTESLELLAWGTSISATRDFNVNISGHATLFCL
jgi:hypothetical protein